MKNSKYDIIVLSDDHASQKQFRISKRLIVTTTLSAIFGLIGLVGMGIYMARGLSSESIHVDLRGENEELKAANERYLEVSIDMERRLNLFEEKTRKLALLVGVEEDSLEEDGIGGPDILEEELSRYLRYDLGLLEQKTELLEQSLETLEDAFATRVDHLESTPSILPAKGWISSTFKHRKDPFTGKRKWHNGIDVSAPLGTPIHAPAKGVITYKGYRGSSGNLLEISHGNGIVTKYAHLDRFNVTKGQRVKRGDLIGYVGSTGRSTAPHLHYEIAKDKKSINPMKYIIRERKVH